MKATITKSELASELQASRSTITNLCQRGLPIRRDGRLNRKQVLTFIAKRTSGFGGGWWLGGMRGKASLAERAQQLLAPRSGKDPEALLAEAEAEAMVHETPGLEEDHEQLDDYLRGVVDFTNAIRRPANLHGVAQWMLDRGAGPEAAFHAAIVYDAVLAIWMSEFIGACLEQEEVEVIEMHPAPDWPAILGCPASDIARWKAEAKERDEKLFGTAEETQPGRTDGKPVKASRGAVPC
jgi:hypothetical protein